MSQGEHDVAVQAKPSQQQPAEAAAQSEEAAGGRFTSGGALPAVGGGFADAKPGPADMAFATQEVAAQGVSGAGGALPHHAAIARSFGAHADSLQGVRAHVGGPAAKA